MKRFAAALALALAAGCAGPGAFFHDAGEAPTVPARSLEELSWRELWTGVVFQGRKVGFARMVVRPSPDSGLWEIETESALRFRLLGTDKRVNLRALDVVRGDLALERFRYDYRMDGSDLRVEGEREGEALVVRATGGAAPVAQRLAMPSPAIPASALALTPVVRGLRVGATAHTVVFVGEAQELAAAEQGILAYERSSLFEGAAFRVSTTLLGLETETWMDAEGRPLLERALHGALISALEEPAAARAYLVEASLSKDEALIDYSLMPSAPVTEARRAAALHVELEGVPETLDIPDAAGQRCAREGARLVCRIDRREAQAASVSPDLQRYLRPTLAVPSNERQFVELAESIVGPAPSTDARIARLLAWIDAHIAKEAVDAFSAADVLRTRRAECQGHAYLFAALARALELPTRVVNGVVYSPEHGGFLYHTWNEVWTGDAGWRAVDATFGQPVADATHVALAIGENAAALAPLAAMVGRARVAALGDVAHW
ncbi:MAG: transglutaminase family protein [Burkholderiales bacterium]